MRPLSQRSAASSAPKPEFQTKMKSRIRGQSFGDEMNNSLNSFNPANSQLSHRDGLKYAKHDHSECQHKHEEFNKTASKLQNSNFVHHEDCLCDSCLCGRHLCKMNVIKPDLTKNTIYQKSFVEQKAIPSLVTYAKEYDKLQGPHLDLNSTYLEGFTNRKGDKVERPHPEDLLHSNGPAPNLSSYSSQFPGYRGDNQYVKPTDKHTRGYFPLRSKSTYANNFVKKEPKKDDYTYFPDQLKTGSNWYGKTTYGKFYEQPNPQYFAKPVKIIEKKQENPDFNHQYETTYKNDFINKQTPICPAKIHLETRARGTFMGTIGKFAENTDFKAISTNFHAISTSKHSYV